jgi:hypothetical protein
VPFRDLLNLDHKKFDLRSTKANFIVGVWETVVKSTLWRSEFAYRCLLKLQEIPRLDQERWSHSAIISHVASDTTMIDKWRLSLGEI